MCVCLGGGVCPCVHRETTLGRAGRWAHQEGLCVHCHMEVQVGGCVAALGGAGGLAVSVWV